MKKVSLDQAAVQGYGVHVNAEDGRLHLDCSCIKSLLNIVFLLSFQVNSPQILLSIFLKLISRLWKRLIATTKPCDVHIAKQEHMGCPLLWVAFFFCAVVIIRNSWKWLPHRAASQWWRLTALLICYIALLTCLPVWVNMASKRWRLPLSPHSADWLSLPSTQQ